MDQPMHDNITAKDLERLTESMSREGLSRLEWSLDGLDLEIDWEGPAGDEANVVKTRQESSFPQEDLITDQPEVTTYHAVRAKVAGVLNWQVSRALEPGDCIKDGELVAFIRVGTENAEIISPITGRVLHVQSFENGAFVACGQWLFSVGS